MPLKIIQLLITASKCFNPYSPKHWYTCTYLDLMQFLAYYWTRRLKQADFHLFQPYSFIVKRFFHKWHQIGRIHLQYLKGMNFLNMVTKTVSLFTFFIQLSLSLANLIYNLFSFLVLFQNCHLAWKSPRVCENFTKLLKHLHQEAFLF